MFDNFSLPAILISYVALLFSLSVHEASHATAAFLLEDRTAQRMGRMTLNPIAHMDPIGTFLFPLIGMSTGIPFIGWAKPVPVNPVNLTRRLRMKTSYAMVAFAGPASNLVLSLVFSLLPFSSLRHPWSTSISGICYLNLLYRAMPGSNDWERSQVRQFLLHSLGNASSSIWG